MSKEEMLEYITGKLPDLDYLGVEMVYGLIQGITGTECEKSNLCKR